MKYAKPELLAAISACEVVEHSALDKGKGVYFDSSSQMYIDTVNAYEADE